jgi:hypothetical protein
MVISIHERVDKLMVLKCAIRGRAAIRYCRAADVRECTLAQPDKKSPSSPCSGSARVIYLQA